MHRRYSDLEWLMQALQVRYPACLIPPIPPKLNPLNFAADDSEEIKLRRYGIQNFLDFVTKHKLLCGSEDLASFLTGQDHDFEQRKATTYVYLASDELNKMLSSVLIDGSQAFQEIQKDKSMLGKTVDAVRQATVKIQDIGGYISSAIWSGAAYITGGTEEQS